MIETVVSTWYLFYHVGVVVVVVVLSFVTKSKVLGVA